MCLPNFITLCQKIKKFAPIPTFMYSTKRDFRGALCIGIYLTISNSEFLQILFHPHQPNNENSWKLVAPTGNLGAS